MAGALPGPATSGLFSWSKSKNWSSSTIQAKEKIHPIGKPTIMSVYFIMDFFYNHDDTIIFYHDTIDLIFFLDNSRTKISYNYFILSNRNMILLMTFLLFF
jgi:hypothetical protein